MPFDRIDELLATVAVKGPAPGVVGLVTDATQTVFEGAAGVRAIGHDTPMTVDTVFWVASMTKPLTATAAMQLVERGLLDLDSPVARWLPQLAQIAVCEGFDEDGQPLLRPAKRPITLRQLLTHTSGFAYPAFNATHLAYESVSGTPALLSCQLASLSMPLMFDPGERWEYGMSTDWVGRLVETVSGQSLGAYLELHVLGPLDMRDTRFRRTPSMQARLA